MGDWGSNTKSTSVPDNRPLWRQKTPTCFCEQKLHTAWAGQGHWGQPPWRSPANPAGFSRYITQRAEL